MGASIWIQRWGTEEGGAFLRGQRRVSPSGRSWSTRQWSGPAPSLNHAPGSGRAVPPYSQPYKASRLVNPCAREKCLLKPRFRWFRHCEGQVQQTVRGSAKRQCCWHPGGVVMSGRTRRSLLPSGPSPHIQDACSESVCGAGVGWGWWRF